MWQQLNEWAGQGLKAALIVLIEGRPGEVGLSAAIKGPGRPPQGPLTGAPFWPDDWAAHLAEAAEGFIPETGLIIQAGARRYRLSYLTYPCSALVLGGGHVGSALCDLLRFLEFEVTLQDDRPEFLKGHLAPELKTVEAPFEHLGRRHQGQIFDAVIIVTRGHAQDTSCLRETLSWPRPPRYLGMIGSRRRTGQTLQMLAAEGFPADRLKRVHTPVGLAIGAQTPAEIAVSIAAEVILVLNRGERMAVGR